MAKRKLIEVPDDCVVLADLIFEAFKDGYDKESVLWIKHDIQAAAAFLDEVDDDTPLRDFDILDFGWTPEAGRIIRQATGQRRRKAG